MGTYILSYLFVTRNKSIILLSTLNSIFSAYKGGKNRRQSGERLRVKQSILPMNFLTTKSGVQPSIDEKVRSSLLLAIVGVTCSVQSREERQCLFKKL